MLRRDARFATDVSERSFAMIVKPPHRHLRKG
jgi:hypothetical protein